MTAIALSVCSYDNTYASAIVGTGDTAKVCKVSTSATAAHGTMRPPIVIDVLKRTPPNKLLDTTPYNEVLRDIIRRYEEKEGTVIAHTRESRDLVRCNHPFFSSMYLAYIGTVVNYLNKHSELIPSVL